MEFSVFFMQIPVNIRVGNALRCFLARYDQKKYIYVQ